MFLVSLKPEEDRGEDHADAKSTKETGDSLEKKSGKASKKKSGMLYGRAMVISERKKKVSFMRKEWERPKGPAIKNKLKTSAPKFSALRKWTKIFRLRRPKAAESPKEKWPDEWTDTGTVD